MRTAPVRRAGEEVQLIEVQQKVVECQDVRIATPLCTHAALTREADLVAAAKVSDSHQLRHPSMRAIG